MDDGLLADTFWGYCPALASIFMYSDCSGHDDPKIAALLRNFALEWPLWFQQVLQWSLPLVLSLLKGAPFEHLEDTSLEYLTQKTVYLMGDSAAMTSGLPVAVVTVVELPGFLAKNQALTGSPLIEIPALMTHKGTFDLDYSLCPVWALYLQHVSPFCGS